MLYFSCVTHYNPHYISPRDKKSKKSMKDFL